MQLSISNIAWESSDDQKIIKVLKKNNIKNIDIALGKYFSNIEETSKSQISNLKEKWLSNDIKIFGIQSLLYGKPEFNIFKQDQSKKKLFDYLENICSISKQLGAEVLVFGSPKNRDKKGIREREIFSLAKEFFIKFAEIANYYNLTVCIEPNPEIYQCNFLTNTADTLAIIKTINKKNLKMNLDIGSISINKENMHRICSQNGKYIGHIHISEAYLKPINKNFLIHNEYASIIKKFLPSLNPCIEMLVDNEKIDDIKLIDEAIEFLDQIYRN